MTPGRPPRTLAEANGTPCREVRLVLPTYLIETIRKGRESIWKLYGDTLDDRVEFLIKKGVIDLYERGFIADGRRKRGR